MTTKLEPLLTIADLDSMPDDGNRYEIIQGELLVSCASSLKHQRISGRLYLAISLYLMKRAIGEVIAVASVIFDEYNGVIPDLVFFTNERQKEIADGDRITGAPDLIIEILSPGADNERRDRTVKRQLYGKFRVSEYWLVNPQTESVEIYRTDDKNRLKFVVELGREDAITSPVLPGFSCPVKSIFVY